MTSETSITPTNDLPMAATDPTNTAPEHTPAPVGSPVKGTPSPVKGTESPAEDAGQAKPQMDDSLARKLHMLSKREKEVMAKRKEIEESSSKYKPYEDLRANAKKNPIAVLEHFGISYDELTDFIIAGSDPEAQRYSELQNQINMLKQEKESEAIAARTAKEESAVNSFKSTIASSIDPEKHELCALHGDEAIDSAYKLMEAYWAENEKMLDVSVALDWIEEHLEEQVAPILKTKKISSKFAPPAPVQPVAPSMPAPQQAVSSRPNVSGTTIGSSMSTSGVQSSTDDSESARLARAANLLRRK